MLTIEMLFAILQGLPSAYYAHLTPRLKVFCDRIRARVRAGDSPPLALTRAFEEATEWERGDIKQMLTQSATVMHLPGLSRLEKETLLALRHAKTASLAQLSHALQRDRSNTFRRLAAIVKKGHAIRFYNLSGLIYIAVDKPLDKKTRRAIHLTLSQIFVQLETDAPAKITTNAKVARTHKLQRV